MVEFESTVSKGLQVHVPSHVAKHLELREGNTLVWDVKDEQPVEVRKKNE